MKKFYFICFWLLLVFVLIFSLVALFYSKGELIKDFALPMAAGIFAFGQLWQQEKQNEFEQNKYIKENYFELMSILNTAYTFETDISDKEFPVRFSQQCIKQIHHLTLFKTKALILFENRSKELEPLIVKLQHGLDNMLRLMLEARHKPSQENHIQFNTAHYTFANDAEILGQFLRKHYDEKVSC